MAGIGHRCGLYTRMRHMVLLGALALLACGDSEPDLAKLDPSAVILAYGDSLTHGTGASPGNSYPKVLAAITGREVINAGVPGEITRQGLRRLPGVLARVQPALVVLCHGGNDLLRRLDPENTERNIRSMIQLARESGAQVVLLGVPAPGLLLGTAELYERVAGEMSVPLEDETIADLLGDNRYKSDAVHPNDEGYRRLAESVKALLVEHGAL